MRCRRLVLIVCSFSLLAASCGSSDDPDIAEGETAACDESSVPSDLDGRAPGDVLASAELDIPPDQIQGARAWQVLYVSTGVSAEELLAVCAVIVAPSEPSAISHDGTGKMVAWSHATIGVEHDCQPSQKPEHLIFGKTPGGIGAVSFGSFFSFNDHTGPAESGILQTMIDRGWVVAATDYFAGFDGGRLQPYLIGQMEAANVLDSARAAVALLDDTYPRDDMPTEHDMLVWGHSQGGHAAMFSAQLAEAYQQATTPSREIDLRLAGVALEAPASSFVATPGTPESLVGRHLGDLEMHQEIDVQIFDFTIDRLAIGPAIMSYMVGPWAEWSTQAAGGDLQAYPSSAGSLEQNALVTDASTAPSGSSTNGATTVSDVTQKCLTASESLDISRAVRPYLDPQTNAFLQQPMWGEADAEGNYEGRLDETCLTTDDAGVIAWCEWLSWNMPGPAGTNDYPKVPTRPDGSLAPVYIAQGTADTVVHCVHDGGAVPPPEDCMSRQLYDDLSARYCPAGAAEGHLTLDLWRSAGRDSPGTHMSIPGQAADNGNQGFVGSRLDEFMNSVLTSGSASPGCNAEVVN